MERKNGKGITSRGCGQPPREAGEGKAREKDKKMGKKHPRSRLAQAGSGERPVRKDQAGRSTEKNRHGGHKQATLSLLMVVSSHCGATGGAATPCPVMQGKSGTRNTQKACNQKPRHPCTPEGVPMREGEKKVSSEGGRQGEAWEGHALKSHCSAPEHTAKAQGKSKPAGGGQQSPSGLSAKTS